MNKRTYITYDIDDVKKLVSGVLKKTKLTDLSSKVIDLSGKVYNLSKRMDEVAGAAKIIQENEQNFRDLGTLKHRLDTLDKILVSVDKIAGGVKTYREQQELNSTKLVNHGDRLEKVEKHLHLTITP